MKRNISIDLLRITCSILVVFIHVSPPFSNKNESMAALLLNPVFRVSLPLFFMISGYLILNSKIDSLFEFYKKRIKTIALPFLFFSFIHYCFFHQWDSNQLSVTWFKNYFIAVFYGYPINTGGDYFMTALFWFVYTIIGLYLISPLISRCISFIDSKNAMKSIIIILAIYAFQQFSPEFLGYMGASKDWFRLQRLNEFLVYFVLGGIIARTALRSTALIWIIMPVCYFIVVYQQYLAVDGHWMGRGWIDANVFMMILCSCILILTHTYKVERYNAKIIYLSSLTYGVYLIQAVTISLADWVTKEYKVFYLQYTIITGILACLIAFCISAIINPIIKKL
ncbi:TPA: acyltransferase [Escherichia coli]|nr:acyltransferase [Escherichia coli]